MLYIFCSLQLLIKVELKIKTIFLFAKQMVWNWYLARSLPESIGEILWNKISGWKINSINMSKSDELSWEYMLHWSASFKELSVFQ